VLDALDASAVRQWSGVAAEAMEAHRREIDDLNVFPVPDGDTGTNLSLTLQAAADTLAAEPAASAGEALRAWSRGAVLGARGNSGVIMSQILCGLADGVGPTEPCDGPLLGHALRSAADQAYASVAVPLEGTILSVARAAAEAAAAGDTVERVVRRARDAAWIALRHTTEQLPALTRAAVVDAGGRGLVVVLDALAEVVTGMAVGSPATGPTGRSRGALEAAVRESGSEQFGYEVQYLLHAADERLAELRSDLGLLGDSLVVVGSGDGLWNVHVHVNDVGAAIEAGVRAGQPSRITVVRFADDTRTGSGAERRRPGSAVVAVAPGEGLAHLFEGEGVHVVDGGPTDNPSTEDVLAAVLACNVDHVVLLPNASQVSGVAEAAAVEARGHDIEVAVVPTRSPVQGLSAVAVHDPVRRFGDDVIAMAEAAAATRWAEVTVAQREALTMAGRCQPGDVLGLIDGEVVEIGPSVASVADAIIDRLLAVGGELITVLVGRDAEPGAGETLRRHILAIAAHVEVGVFDGGQPHYPLLIGVE
jgi:uncharacterized protein